MSTAKNIGVWSARVDRSGKASQLIVSGTFPTKGEKIEFKLAEIFPLSFNERILRLVIINGHVIDENGTFEARLSEEFKKNLGYQEYDSVSININNEEDLLEIASIVVEPLEDNALVKSNHINEDELFLPYREILNGIEISRDLMKIKVPSRGLTDKRSFEINIIKGITGIPPYILEVVRVKSDLGKAYLPDGVILEYTASELDEEFLSTYTLLNQLG
ncbi:hypothetical protein [Sphingobacterium sp.]|uniref:hypothetical protein n=1 Tax=Sphingobacterium sp. TaxID=341027 RepID=UPI0028964CEC|nr:hypothetical protein [Sphingobacterium sp.]